MDRSIRACTRDFRSALSPAIRLAWPNLSQGFQGKSKERLVQARQVAVQISHDDTGHLLIGRLRRRAGSEIGREGRREESECSNLSHAHSDTEKIALWVAIRRHITAGRKSLIAGLCRNRHGHE